MPKIYYDDIKIIKAPKKPSLKKLFFFILGLIFLAVIIFLASLVTDTVKITNFSFNAFSKNNKYSFKYYILCLGSYDNLDEAEKVSVNSTLLGSSGYIWEEDKKYYVVGSAYASMEDAKSVQNNISNSEYKTEILTIKISFDKILNEKFEKNQMDKIKECVIYLKSLTNNLIGNSIKLDKKEISYIVASSNLNNLKSDLLVHKNNFSYILDNTNNNVINLNNCILKIESLLDKTINCLIQNENVSYNLKNCLVQVIRFCYEVNF